MHHRPPRAPRTSARSAAPARSAHRPGPRRALIVFAVVLAVATGAVLLGRVATPGDPGTVTQDAAAQRALTAGGTQQRTGTGGAATATARNAAAMAATDARGGHRGDHRRQVGQQDAPVANPNCTLIVPTAPTSAGGLTTPYQLVATDRGQGDCHEANADQAAFVEAAIYDPAAHEVSIYHPLVVDRRDSPAVPPTPVTLPAGAVVGVWFGFNGDTLTLAGPGAGDCVNGLPGSPFGQFAYCNAPAFFTAANGDGTLQGKIPALGTSPKDGRPCPTTRDFSVVDQDQSDNLATAYRVINGRMAQTTPATAHRGTALTNGSDEGLVAKFITPALGCQPFTGKDLNNGGAATPALALNELSAAVRQGAPQALVPVSDPMVLVDERQSTEKTNLYRAGVDMGTLQQAPGQSPREYCTNIVTLGSARLAADAAFLRRAASPDAGQPNLLAFLQDRLQTTLQNLKCTGAATRQADAQTQAQPDAQTQAQPDAQTADQAPADTGTGTGTGMGTDQQATTPSPAAAPTTSRSTPAPAAAATSTPARHRTPTPVGTTPARPSPASATPVVTAPTGTRPAAATPVGTGG